MQPSPDVNTAKAPARKYLVRQKAVDRRFYDPLSDKLGQEPHHVKNKDINYMQLSPHSLDTTQQSKGSARGQGARRIIAGDLQGTEQDTLVNSLAQRTENNKSKIPIENVLITTCESDSEDEGLGSGDSLGSSPPDSSLDINTARRKTTILF